MHGLTTTSTADPSGWNGLIAAPLDEAFGLLASGEEGLSAQAAAAALARHGPNRIAEEGRLSALRELWRHAKSPLNGLLLALAAVSWALSDLRSAVVIAVMVVLSVGLGFVQEHRSNLAARRLKRMVQVHASLRRPGLAGADAEGFAEVPLEQVVPGDIVRLSAGDLIPADLRLVHAHDLFVNQSSLTGEAMPVEKEAITPAPGTDPLDRPDLCFMGASVVSGYAVGLVLRTGRHTFFGEIAEKITHTAATSSFEKGVNRFVWLMLRFMLVMAPTVFLINGLTKHNWWEALFFAVAVAVGLAPEMLPMVVTMNLARGAIAMAGKRTIVKRLDAIQNFGAMDVLCTDKTGTLTQDKVVLRLALDAGGHRSEEVLAHAWLNSHHE
ncbi:MAG TPA: HAD-IC family P-type ATPase, partial [Novosphingobium sp.]|nr:HAD-IC family P-type ATPase [Novosphingobium sp.]